MQGQEYPIPTADEVARILIASFRMVNADPRHVIAKLHGRQTQYGMGIVAGRRYAALALRQLFPNLSERQIGRMVGIPDDSNFIGNILSRRALGRIPDFDQTDFDRILRNCRVQAREPVKLCCDETEPARVVPAVVPVPKRAAPPARRGALFGPKRRLEDELRQAVQNTAAMQRPERA